MDNDLKKAYNLAASMDSQRQEEEQREQEKIQSFLKTISMIESSGGKNTNHPTIQSGMHKGHAAAGQYGLMPNTVQEVVGRMEREGYRFPQMPQDRSPASIKQSVESNPNKEQRIAEYLAKQVLERQKGDEEKAAYSWFQGHNLTPEQIAAKNYEDHDYVQKFKNLKNILGK